MAWSPQMACAYGRVECARTVCHAPASFPSQSESSTDLPGSRSALSSEECVISSRPNSGTQAMPLGNFPKQRKPMGSLALRRAGELLQKPGQLATL